MFKSAATRIIPRNAPISSKVPLQSTTTAARILPPLIFPLQSQFIRPTSSSSSASASVQNYKMNGNREDHPPKHQMVHFPGLTSSKRSFGEFRTVLHTGLYSQVVAMEIPVGGDIGDEVHTVDQILLFTSGTARATVAGVDKDIKASDVVVVPAGTQHQFVNTGDTPLEVVTVYSPAEHKQDTVHKTKEEGDKAEEEGRDEAPGWSRRGKKENEEAGLVRESGKYENE